MDAVNLKLKPLPVPVQVTVELKLTPMVDLSELPDEVLENLVNEFAEAVVKAARPEPKTEAWF
jgi:hypothetical protein